LVCLNIGGRAGIIAFFSNLFTTLIVYLIGLSGVYKFDAIGLMWDKRNYDQFNYIVYICAPIVSMVTHIGVYTIQYHKKEAMKQYGPGCAYGIITITGALLLSLINDEFYKDKQGKIITYGKFLIGVMNTGALGGVTINRRFKTCTKGYYFYFYLCSGYLAGWLFFAFYGLAFLGGKQGVIAFIANNMIIRSLEFFNWIYKFDRLEEEEKEKVKNEKNQQLISTNKIQIDNNIVYGVFPTEIKDFDSDVIIKPTEEIQSPTNQIAMQSKNEEFFYKNENESGTKRQEKVNVSIELKDNGIDEENHSTKNTKSIKSKKINLSQDPESCVNMEIINNNNHS